MNTNDLIAGIRMSAFIPDPAQAPDYSDARLMVELNNLQSQLYERSIVNSKQGYWRKALTSVLSAGSQNITVPPRACAGGLSKVDIATDSQLRWFPIDECDEDNIRLYETNVQGTPAHFIMRADQIVLMPPADGGTYNFRISYYLRPSYLVLPQTAGLVTSQGGSDTFVNAVPLDQVTGSPITVGSIVDIVRPTGWHEVIMVSGTVLVVSGTDIQVSWVGQDPSQIQKGDYLRAAEQTDWPALPDDYHRTLVDVIAAKICTQQGMSAKAAALQAEFSQDLVRFLDLLSPRVKHTGGTDIVMPFGLYRGYGRTRVAKFP